MDTDVVVAAVRSRQGASRAWLRAALLRRCELVLSVPLLLQYEEVLCRPEQLAAVGGSVDDIGTMLDAVCRVGSPVEIDYLWRPMLREPDDEMVLELAIQSRAAALLTFNLRDFQGAERFGVEVVRPGPAWRRWKETLT